MRFVITGATGRMGSTLIDLLEDHPVHDLHVAVTRDLDLQEDSRFVATSDLDAHLEDADAIIDFTLPEATTRFVSTAADVGVPFISGTTGLDSDAESALDGATEVIPVCVASNFSIGIHALTEAVTAAIERLDGYDIEVTETHHAGKEDAPSGTALELVAEIEAHLGDLSERVYGREGVQPRTTGEIGIFARRAGDIRGEHEVLIAGNDEMLSLTHRVGSRAVFAAGAITAAEWTATQPPGRYDMTDVLR